MKLQRHLLRDQIREAILKQIGSGVLAPGQRVVEAILADEFKVSSIPIREAIRELTAMGVLISANHKGAWVRKISITETIEALQVKSTLESLAARLAAPTLQHRCAELQKKSDAILEASRRRDFVTYQEANQVFHRTILEASGNGVLLKMWNTLAFEVRTRAILQFLEKEDPVEMAREHEAIVEAFESANPTEACRLLALHSDRLVEHLSRELAASPQSSQDDSSFVASEAGPASSGGQTGRRLSTRPLRPQSNLIDRRRD